MAELHGDHGAHSKCSCMDHPSELATKCPSLSSALFQQKRVTTPTHHTTFFMSKQRKEAHGHIHNIYKFNNFCTI